MRRRTLAVVCAGLRRPSATRLLADRLAAATARALAARGEPPVVRVVEARDHARALADHLLTGESGGELRAALDTVVRADALIAVTPIVNASYSGLFKSFFDAVERGALAGMPVLVAATGGTPRHTLALEYTVRPLFTYLRSVVVPTAVYATATDGEAAEQDLSDRADRAGRELAALVDHERRPAAVTGRAVSRC